MSAEAPIPGQPLKDQEVPFYQFKYTREIIRRFQERGFNQEQYEPFTSSLNGYLARKANTEGLIALGIIATPGSEGMADYMVEDRDGLVMDAIGYWSSLSLSEDPKERGNKNYTECIEWLELDYTSKVSAVNFESRSQSDYLSLEAFEAALQQDAGVRRSMTLTAGNGENLEFWGFVTTEQLREEMRTTQSQQPEELSEEEPAYPRIKLRSEDTQNTPLSLTEHFGALEPGQEGELLALVDFVTDLHKIPGVDAVAFLTVQEGLAPTTLVKEVFAPLRRDDQESARIVREVSEAQGRLSRQERTLMGGLSFVNTARFNVESLLERVQERWRNEGRELVVLVEFERD